VPLAAGADDAAVFGRSGACCRQSDMRADVLAWPTISERALVYAIGSLSIILGVVEATSLTDAREGRERWLGAAASVAALVFGVAMLASGGRGLDLIATLLGVGFIAIGSLRLVRAVAARRSGGAIDAG
jgi:uncharacterized membrane protein HdeD (DUF308 family)